MHDFRGIYNKKCQRQSIRDNNKKKSKAKKKERGGTKMSQTLSPIFNIWVRLVMILMVDGAAENAVPGS